MKAQQRDLEDTSLRHLDYSIFGLWFLAVAQWSIVIDAAAAAPKKFHVPLGHWCFVKASATLSKGV